MKERPILFSTTMVRAILEGRKTQTRRVVTSKKERTYANDLNRVSEWSYRDGKWQGYEKATGSSALPIQLLKCPYGNPGDRLWVRETWAPHDEQACRDQDAGMVYYRADDEAKYESDGPWKPSIFMPRWASRITLEITDVRVERLRDISEEEAMAEGVAIDRGNAFHVAGHEGKWAHVTARGCFETLWGSINGPSSWKANPWVWVISFRRLDNV